MKFTINNKEYPIEITMKDALKTYPNEFGIKLTTLFEEDNLNELMTRMFLGDELAIQLLTHYTKSSLSYDELIEVLTPANVKEFKDKWWEALMDFFDHPRNEFLKDILAVTPAALKERLNEAVLLMSKPSSTSSLEKVAST